MANNVINGVPISSNIRRRKDNVLLANGSTATIVVTEYWRYQTRAIDANGVVTVLCPRTRNADPAYAAYCDSVENAHASEVQQLRAHLARFQIQLDQVTRHVGLNRNVLPQPNGAPPVPVFAPAPAQPANAPAAQLAPVAPGEDEIALLPLGQRRTIAEYISMLEPEQLVYIKATFKFKLAHPGTEEHRLLSEVTQEDRCALCLEHFGVLEPTLNSPSNVVAQCTECAVIWVRTLLNARVLRQPDLTLDLENSLIHTMLFRGRTAAPCILTRRPVNALYINL